MLSGQELGKRKENRRRLRERRHSILTLRDAAYPRRLADIRPRLPCFYVRGRLPAVDEPRYRCRRGNAQPRPYGLKMATRLGYELTAAAACRLRPDYRSDSAAFAARLTTGASLYRRPRHAHRRGRQKRRTRGRRRPSPGGGQRVPARSRALSVHSSGATDKRRASVAAVVVEAPAKRRAVRKTSHEPGREIFAVPGNVRISPNSVGTNDLLMDLRDSRHRCWDIPCGFGAQVSPGLADPAVRAPQMPRNARSRVSDRKAYPAPQSSASSPETASSSPMSRRISPELLKDLDETQLALVRAIDGHLYT